MSSFFWATPGSRKPSAVLELLRQGDEVTEMWFGDVLGGEMWEPLYHMSESQPDVVREFVLTPGLEPYVRAQFTACMSQVALHQPGRKKMISLWFRDLFTTLEKTSLEDNIIDSDFIALPSAMPLT